MALRTYGRLPVPSGPIVIGLGSELGSGIGTEDDSGVIGADSGGTVSGGTWVEVTTDANGYDDAVWLTTLIQALKLNTGESPFFANYGIPAHETVVTQVFPDYYAAQTQVQFSPYFASLSITRVQGSFPPVYDVYAVCHSGAVVGVRVATGQIQVPS